MAKKPDPRQSSLFDLGTVQPIVEMVSNNRSPRLTAEELASAMSRLAPRALKVDLTGPQMNYRQCLIEQIMRDRQTLAMGSEWAPSREFFEERIASYTATVREME